VECVAVRMARRRWTRLRVSSEAGNGPISPQLGLSVRDEGRFRKHIQWLRAACASGWFDDCRANEAGYSGGAATILRRTNHEEGKGIGPFVCSGRTATSGGFAKLNVQTRRAEN